MRHGLFETVTRLQIALQRQFSELPIAPERMIITRKVGGCPAGCPHIHLDVELPGNRRGNQFADFVLKREDVGDRPIVTFGLDGFTCFNPR